MLTWFFCSIFLTMLLWTMATAVDFYRFFCSRRNDANANVVLCNLNLNFQGQTLVKHLSYKFVQIQQMSLADFP